MPETANESNVVPLAPAHAADRRMTARGVMSRDRIIAAGLELVRDGGYAALSISAICKRADVSAASLYHHFGDKAGLAAAMIEESIRESARRFAKGLVEQATPRAQLEAFFDLTLELARDPMTDTVRVMLAMADGAAESRDVADALARARAHAWALTAAEFAERFDLADGALLTHLHFAFVSYAAHVAKTSTAKDESRALFASYKRVMLITVAALRPDLLDDQDFAAAVTAAARAPRAATSLETDDD